MAINLENFITTTVIEMQGIKATELAMIAAEFLLKEGEPLSFNDYITCVETLINKKQILEIEYTVPNLDFRVKSFYLPGNSTISIRSV
jgi:hypothetical protein